MKAQTVTNTAPDSLNIQTQSITNKQGKVFSPRDVRELHSLGYSNKQIVDFEVIEQPKTASKKLVSTSPDLKNALVYVTDFLGNGKTGLPADVISLKKNSLKFRFGGKDFAYSGHFSVLLTTPRKHKNPFAGLSSPEMVKLLTLENFLKGQSNETVLLPNAKIWEKSDNFIDAEALGIEWIHSGSYSISN